MTAVVRAAKRSCQNAAKAQKSTTVRVHPENPGEKDFLNGVCSGDVRKHVGCVSRATE
jgi:hypothetical protein